MAIHTIIYKSGAKVRVKAKNFTVEKSGGLIQSITWTNDINKKPLHIGVDDIAAIYVGRV